MPRTITCPSGLKGVVRGVRGGDTDRMVDPTNAADMHTLIRGAWAQTIEPGPLYAAAMGKGGKLNMSKVYSFDRFYILMWCSILTYGDLYAFQLKCGAPTNPCHPSKPILWGLKLSELPIKAVPEATIKKLAAGENLFETTAPVGDCDFGDPERLVKFQCIDEESEIAAAKAIEGKPKARFTTGFRARVKFIEGLDDQGLDIPRELALTPQWAFDALQERFEEVEGGVITDLKGIVCQGCGWSHEVSLPLGSLFDRKRVKLARLWSEMQQPSIPEAPSESSAPTSSLLST